MIQIIENFYIDPDDVRKFALDLDFNVSGNYPGLRTTAMSEEWRNYIKKFLEDKIAKKITYFPDGYNTAFQLTLENAKTWIHHDSTDWAGVLYLTPNAPVESGTGIYRHKSGIFMHKEGQLDYNDEKLNDDEWEKVVDIGNIYNRLVLYSGMYYHRSVVPGFGTNKEDGRLFQTFFFNT